ncbi:6829_t:CDS:2 [Dentiscutata erythropus]|uniref:6829_t:CDS:1 n=1 Tax=Dentiscutata erythropus TaxID=1348616 RepID=A0A9N9B2Y3_9GLOM|nr:6829_t:CDS:2 [Dentiscutata erythropus]
MNGPPKTSYIKYSKRAFFTYSSKEVSTFQHGYLGIGPSYITGNFHLCYPTTEPLHLKRIEISFVGQESALIESTYSIRSHRKFSRGSFEVDGTLYASISYTLKATIISNKNVEKIVSVKCHINRWCLPMEALERPIVMKNPDHDKTKEYKVGDIIINCEWCMGDKISMFINLTSSKQNIKEVNIKEVNIKEVNIKEIRLNLLELQYVIKNNEIVTGHKLETTNVIIDKKKLSNLPHPSGNKYSFEVGMQIPSNNDTKFTPANIGTIRMLQHIKVVHRLKAHIKFDSEHLVFQGDIGIINSLTSKQIKEGMAKGYIYY